MTQYDAESSDALMLENAALRAVLYELLYQLTLLTKHDESYLWRIGGRPLDAAYKSAKRTLETIEGRDG